MIFSDYWRRLCLSNPSLEDEGTRMTITVAAFKKSVRRAFESGGKTEESLKSAASQFRNVGGKPHPFGDIFGGGGIFG